MLDLKIDTQFMQTHTLSFRLPIDDDKVQYLAEDQEMEFDGHKYFVKTLEDYREGNEAYVEVTCHALWYRLGERVYSGTFNVLDKTPEEGVLMILAAALSEAELDWELGQQPENDGIYSMDPIDASYLDLLFQWCKITNHELDFDTIGQKVLMSRNIGGGQVISFRYKRNLTSIHRVVVPPEVTRIYPYGRNDLDISGVTGDEVYLEDYSFYTNQGMTESEARTRYRKDDVYRDDSFIDDQSLYRAALARLTLLAQPIITYTAKVVDLSDVTGYDESHFRMGDSVLVEDEPLGIQVVARIVRYVRFPYEPNRNEVELSFLPLALPDPKVSSARATLGAQWELFASYNTITPYQVRNGHVILHRLPLRAQSTAEWLANLTIHGTGVGTCNLIIQAFDTMDESNFWPLATIPVTDGELVRYGFSFGLKEVPTGLHGLSIRAYSDTGGCGIDVEQLASAFSVLARGTTQETLTFDNSIIYSYTGAVQSFQVPDDVWVIHIQAYGAQGGSIDGCSGGLGGRVEGNYNVTPGTLYDVYVGGYVGASPSAGWPNGGAGDSTGLNNGPGGGGSSDVRPTGTTIIDTIVCAPAGGGAGGNYNADDSTGGYGGYLFGIDGSGTWPGQGASQTAGGAGGFGAGDSGQAGSLGQGGNAGHQSNAFSKPSGGGGGGYYGGGGAGCGAGAGNSGAGGGGGSGWVDPFVFDVETEDGTRTTYGQVTISWDDPTIE